MSAIDARTHGTPDLVQAVVDSPVGPLTLVVERDGGALVALYMDGQRRPPGTADLDVLDGGVLDGGVLDGGVPDGGPDGGARDRGALDEGSLVAVRAQLSEYFAGTRTVFDLVLAPRGNTFQRRVWDLLTGIPYGTTRTYGDLARELGDPALAQAVGSANGRNPLGIVVPCHRVVGSDGRLVGYAGGLERKRFLLDLEQGTVAPTARLF